MRDEAQRRARIVGGACTLFEDYVEREWAAGRLSLSLKAGPSAVVLHGHCHQRAMSRPLAAGAGAVVAHPGARRGDFDSGCCGMAGSFGYEKNHYEISHQIGERRLLPAARELEAGHVLVAAGTSCRHQVVHFTGVRAQHPAVLLRALLAQDFRPFINFGDGDTLLALSEKGTV